MKLYEKPLVNYAQLARVVGLLMMFEGIFLLLPALVCLYYHETDWLPFVATAVITAGIGALLMTKIRPKTSYMGKREGYLLTALVWVIFSLFGMLPFLTCSYPMTVSDAFFEAMSGFTTTGASVLPDDAVMSHGIMFWRALMQWVGGMGIILFTLALVPMLNHSGGMQMFNAEVTGITHDKIRPRISQTAKSLWAVYILLTIILTLLLWAGPMDGFDSICHAFGAISTGGYTTDSSATAAYGSGYIKIVLTLFMALSGVNFGLIFKSVTGNFSALRNNDVVRSYLYAILIFTALFIISGLITGTCRSWQSASIDPIFQVVSIITSTGYSHPGSEWNPFILSLVFIMMFTGACAGSTSGGAKIDRILFLVKNSRNEVYRCIHPNTIMSVRINGKVINSDLVNKVIAFLCIYLIVVLAGGVAITALGVDLPDAFFSSFSCMSNTGLDVTITGYGSTFLHMPDAAKWILTMLMLIGRLEIFTVLVLFTPTFWRR